MGNRFLINSCFLSPKNIPFQNTCAALAGSRLPSKNRFALYSKLIFSSDTGKRRAAASAKRNIPLGARRARSASKSAR